MEDWQEQVQELQALKAIFGSDFDFPGVAGSDEADNLQYEALAEGPPPSEGIEAQLLIQLATSQAPFTIQIGGRSAQDSYRAQVTYLPPLSLQLELPPDYPSASRPLVSLSAFWLTGQQLGQLDDKLAELWQEQAGSPVCFAWADWLAHSALDHLGIADRLTIQDSLDFCHDSTQTGAHNHSPSSAAQVRASQSPAASSLQSNAAPYIPTAQKRREALQAGRDHCGPDNHGQMSGKSEPNEQQPSPSNALASISRAPANHSQSAEHMLMQLLAYNARREAEVFRQQHWTCKICFDEVPGSRCLCGAACSHYFCSDCLAQHARSLLAEGVAERLQCPEPGCKQPLLLQRVAPHLTQEEAARWEKMELDNALMRMPDVVMCKRCSTPCLEDKDNCAMCSKCHFVFCSLCQESWHPGTQCMSPETRLKILRERMAGNKASAHALVQQEFELMSLAAIEKSSKACPVCGMAIQKQEGCNKITCGSCGAYFCYRCNKPITGYEHFRDGGCVLFELSDIQRWEHELQEQINRHMGIRLEQQQPAQGADNANQSTCPRCGQGNARVSNNNHMACWACQQHYCFLCRAVLGRKGGGLHFSRRGGCQQHTGHAANVQLR